MSAAFTPGPWAVHARYPGVVLTQDAVPTQIASVNFGDETEANANLIAAAPDLYAELEHARELLAIKGVFVDAIDNALARARGEPA